WSGGYALSNVPSKLADTVSSADSQLAIPTALNDWLDAILSVATHYRLEISRESLRLASAWEKDQELALMVQSLARQAGLVVRFVEPDIPRLTPLRLPIVVQMRDGQVAVINTMDSEQVGLTYSGDGGLGSVETIGSLQAEVGSMVGMRPAQAVRDMRVDDYDEPYERSWLRIMVLRALGPYRQ